MKISKLNLLNFRNYEKLIIKFDNINIFIGDNAQGKTNILESLYILSTTKSFRIKDENSLIYNNISNSSILAEFVDDNNVANKIRVEYYRDTKKKIMINDNYVKNNIDIIGVIKCGLFCPEDIHIIDGDSILRRKFMDVFLCQTDKIYCLTLRNYAKALRQKNQLLRSIKYQKTPHFDLDPWDEQILKYAVEIYNKRLKFINNLNKITDNLHEMLTNNKERLQISYLDSIKEGDNQNPDDYEICFKTRQKRVRPQEIIKGFSLIGPQRDDLEMEINGMNIKEFGSQGQKRTASISMKLAEIQYMKSELNLQPIILIDDIFSELDDKRKESFMKFLDQDMQLFFTGTRLSEFPVIAAKAKIHSIREGKVYPFHGAA